MANKLKYFIGNWKMFGTLNSLNILNRVNKYLKDNSRRLKNSKVVFCIPYTLIYTFSNKFSNQKISIGAQNCHENEKYDSLTGSVNAYMLKKSGANYVIIGHSENRLRGETNFIIKKKIKSVLSQKLKVIFCIGESEIEKKRKKTFNVLRNQLKSSISKEFNLNNIIIAYEPIWSIGTGKVPKTDDLKKTFIFIRKILKSFSQKDYSAKILYGGSVNSKNVALYSKINEIDGFLIGGASQSSKKFIDIIKKYYKNH